MAKIYVTNCTSKFNGFEGIHKEIVEGLKKTGHEVLLSDQEDYNARSILKESDIIIPFLSHYTLVVHPIINELNQLRSYAAYDNKLFLPVYTKDASLEKALDNEFERLGKLVVVKNDLPVDTIVSRIDAEINNFLGHKIAKERKAEEVQTNIKGSATTYIIDTILELESRERILKNLAYCGYAVGFLVIAAGVFIAYHFFNRDFPNIDDKTNWEMIIFISLRGLLIITLLFSLSNYAFNFAKAFMGESLTISYKIHAISFGMFYLKVFNNRLDSNELKEIFRDWNINNHSSSFANQTTKENDPMLFDKVSTVVEKFRGGK